MKLLDKIHAYLKQLNYTDEDIEYFDTSSVYLAFEIANYAHRNQKRKNGVSYLTHAINCLDNYRNLVGIRENDPFCISVDMIYDYALPFDGVQEVCLLHDVLEDTDITIEEISAIYESLDLGKYFNAYIKKPLLLVTKQKGVNYDDYFKVILQDITASMVKFCDMADNVNYLGLDTFGESEYDRCVNYLIYAKIINDKWQFIERANAYRIAFQEKNK